MSAIGRASALLDSAVPDIRTIAQCRWELARILRAYQIHKHRSIFDPIIATGGDTDRVRLARRLKGDCIAMGERFRDHLLCWSAVGVSDAWSDYRPAALAMSAALRDHLERERGGIAALVQGTAAPPPRVTIPPRVPVLRY